MAASQRAIAIKRLMQPLLLVLAVAVANQPAGAEQETTGDPKAERAAIRVKLEKAFANCEHWGGEEPYDERRAADIKRGFERDCLAALLQAQHALAVLPGDPTVAAVAVDLEAYAGPSFPKHRLAPDAPGKENLCATAAGYHAKSTGGKPRFRDYFEEFCPAQAAELPPG